MDPITDLYAGFRWREVLEKPWDYQTASFIATILLGAYFYVLSSIFHNSTDDLHLSWKDLYLYVFVLKIVIRCCP